MRIRLALGLFVLLFTGPLVARAPAGIIPPGVDIDIPQGPTTRLVELGQVTATDTAVLVSARNAARKFLVCTNTSNTLHARLGSATVTATAGVQLRTGSTLVLYGTYPVYAIAETPDVTLSCSEVLR